VKAVCAGAIVAKHAGGYRFDVVAEVADFSVSNLF
jgi:hypothetical protein